MCTPSTRSPVLVSWPLRAAIASKGPSSSVHVSSRVSRGRLGDLLVPAMVETADARSQRCDPPVFCGRCALIRSSRCRSTSAYVRTLGRDWSAAGEYGRKRVSRVDLQLAEDAGEVTLDRAGRDEESLG